MNDERPDEQAATDCCPTGSCCDASAATKPKSQSPWRLIVFCAIVLAALGAIAYSMMTGDEVEATQSTAGATPDAQLAWLAASDELKQAVADNDFVFVVLPDTEPGDGGIMQAVVGAANQAQAKGRRIGVVELAPATAGYTTVSSRFGIEEFPVVLAMASDGSARPVKGEISEQSLLKAYLACSQPSGCCPGGKAAKGCEPSACGK